MKEQVLKKIAASLDRERFTLLDIGCAGGLEPIWRGFGDRFAGLGFDASVSECRRLTGIETNRNVRYVGAFVDIPPDHPFARAFAERRPPPSGVMFPRFSCAATLAMRDRWLKDAPESERLLHNQWQSTEVADSSKPVYAPQVLKELGYDRVDLLKIDVDGPDFRVLNSFDGLFEKFGILGARLEVCLDGSADPTANIFHNTDRFMRQQGYDLACLEQVRTYSMRVLPAQYAIGVPAQTITGRPWQVDALYALDPVAEAGIAERLSNEQLLKLAGIYSVWDQPDSAVEILLAFRDRLASHIDVDGMLDLLALQTQEKAWPNARKRFSYRDYLAFFETDPPQLYPNPPPLDEDPTEAQETLLGPVETEISPALEAQPVPEPAPGLSPEAATAPRPTLIGRLRAAWVALTDAQYIAHVEKVWRP